MFSGIVETCGKVVSLNKEKSNLHITIEADFAKELKIDQSIAHNGACLTVVKRNNKDYTVTAVKETLEKTNLSNLKIGDLLNLERCLKVGDRIDGHIVQGHVDTTALCKGIQNQEGSWVFTFEYPKNSTFITVEKGAICVNGVSLTVIDSQTNIFSVAIIPYTFEHTTFNKIVIGSVVNIEFDVLGKYLMKYNDEKK